MEVVFGEAFRHLGPPAACAPRQHSVARLWDAGVSKAPWELQDRTVRGTWQCQLVLLRGSLVQSLPRRNAVTLRRAAAMMGFAPSQALLIGSLH